MRRPAASYAAQFDWRSLSNAKPPPAASVLDFPVLSPCLFSSLPDWQSKNVCGHRETRRTTWRDNRSGSRAMPSAFVAGSCRQNSTSLAIVPTHATNTRPTQIHTKQANQSNAYRASQAAPHEGGRYPFLASYSQHGV